VRTIRFHFDYLSPYAYIAWTQLPALAARNACAVEPVPTLLAPVLAHGGQKGPAEIPAKRVWVFKDTVRTARVLGIPFSPPPSHPFNPLLALRATIAVEDLIARGRAIDALFAHAWGGAGGGVEDAAVVGAALDRAGLDGAALVERAGQDEIKARLRGDTDEAIGAGVFGVPTMRVEAELFWGFDAFGHLERYLRGEDPLGAGELERWRDLPATARRTLS
jgi:2-hydroxychromene-2-carboxylate isomerase